MRAVYYVLSGAIHLLIGAVQLLMFVRALLSWFPIDDDNPILQFTTAATEPFILPVRALLDRFQPRRYFVFRHVPAALAAPIHPVRFP